MASIKTQCEAAGYSLDKQTGWAYSQRLLEEISFEEARPLLALFPKTYRPPTTGSLVFTPFIADTIPIQDRGVSRNDPFVGIGDGFGSSTQPMRLSTIIQKKEEAVRRAAYSHGFRVMALATLFLMVAAYVK